MTHHLVDPTERGIESDDLATWLLFFLESDGATVALTPAQHVHVDLNTMPGSTRRSSGAGRRSSPTPYQSFGRSCLPALPHRTLP